MKSNALLIAAVVGICALGGFAFYQRQALSRAQADLDKATTQLRDAESKFTELQKAIDKAVDENKSLKAQATEVFKLRNEVTTLRKEQSTLQNQLKVAAQKEAKKGAAPAAPGPATNALPTQFASFEQMTQ